MKGKIIIVVIVWVLLGFIGSGIEQHDKIHVIGNNLGCYLERILPSSPVRDRLVAMNKNFEEFEKTHYGQNTAFYYGTAVLGPINLIASVMIHYQMPQSLAYSVGVEPIKNLDWGFTSQWPLPRFTFHSQK